jgi:hypothetical protein
MKKSFIIVILCLAFGFVNAMPTFAEQTQQAVIQQEAVQAAVYVDANGDTITVVTFKGGAVAVSINGQKPVMGTAALQLLTQAGIILSVSPAGIIVSQSVAPNVVVAQVPVAVAAVTGTAAAVVANVAKEAPAAAKTADSAAGKAKSEAAQDAAQAEPAAAEEAPAAPAPVLPANVPAGSAANVNQQQNDVSAPLELYHPKPTSR